jgi:hypothetical protein
LYVQYRKHVDQEIGTIKYDQIATVRAAAVDTDIAAVTQWKLLLLVPYR